MQIGIKKLHLRTYIGFHDGEQDKKQDVFIHLKINVPFHSSMSEDDISNIYNYKTITKQIINFVENRRFLLLEKLTDDVANLILEDHRVSFVEVEIEKPCALRFTESVSILVQKHSSHE
ncbi:FolB domain-containing protein [Halosquirtibacter xylanolyticus]|uniref:FolB domain-containing protein n=1 Tax=Halosquirtibacter xylanolyticus TaxID=3374599 RepID=UPI00374906EA|nr:FolB domain-containing protein [Prolixibacteraceae bacterium]